MTTINLTEILPAVRAATPNGAGYIIGLGGNVWAVATGVHTLTIDGGQRQADAPVELLICRDGAEVLRTEIHTAREVTALLATIPEVATYGELPELHAIRTTETPTERAMISAMLSAGLWADARNPNDPDDDVDMSDFDHDDVTASDETWLKLRTAVRDFLTELYAKHLIGTPAGMEAYRIVYGNPEQAGHDLWLTMNHGGTGFWDRGYGPAGDVLTELARRHGAEGSAVLVNPEQHTVELEWGS